MHVHSCAARWVTHCFMCVRSYPPLLLLISVSTVCPLVVPLPVCNLFDHTCTHTSYATADTGHRSSPTTHRPQNHPTPTLSIYPHWAQIQIHAHDTIHACSSTFYTGWCACMRVHSSPQAMLKSNLSTVYVTTGQQVDTLCRANFRRDVSSTVLTHITCGPKRSQVTHVSAA
jgi:hypothetical protein